MQVTINISGEELSVEGTHHQQHETYDTPGYNEFEISSVYYKGVNVTDLFEAMDLLERIELECLEKI